ncbi:hypothetical protein KAS31_05140 [Candidatus Parcubacteria bacterium]|nr:hypothetical protein [Candidatus Parcubacteria bacterium]MCK5591727.1 hypothetical protein [Candidatus Paceibacterota bacterium]
MSEHKKFQDNNIGMGRKIAGLPENTPLNEVIIALLEKGEHVEAVELLFGSQRESNLLDDKLGFEIYMQFWIGKHLEILKKIVNSYHWDSEVVDKKRKKGGLKITIYSGETFMIEEPVATELLTAMM